MYNFFFRYEVYLTTNEEEFKSLCRAWHYSVEYLGTGNWAVNVSCMCGCGLPWMSFIWQLSHCRTDNRDTQLRYDDTDNRKWKCKNNDVSRTRIFDTANNKARHWIRHWANSIHHPPTLTPPPPIVATYLLHPTSTSFSVIQSGHLKKKKKKKKNFLHNKTQFYLTTKIILAVMKKMTDIVNMNPPTICTNVCSFFSVVTIQWHVEHSCSIDRMQKTRITTCDSIPVVRVCEK
jgi:hypothetical protein